MRRVVDGELRLAPHHHAISVADLETSLAWYRDRFGFVEESRYEVPEAGMRAVFLARQQVRIEVFEIEGSTAPPIEESVFEHHLSIRGLRHVAFSVADLERARSVLASRGIDFATGVLEVPDGSGSRYCFLTDPDGVLIEPGALRTPSRRSVSSATEPGAAL